MTSPLPPFSVSPCPSHSSAPCLRRAFDKQAWLPLLREALAREGRFRWRLRGDSMAPTLPPDCEIEIAPLPPAVRLGELVVFAAGDMLVAHRLVRRVRGRWITQGDGQRTPDPPLDQAQALGIVTAAYQGSRRCWPHPLSRLRALLWIARHHLLRVWRAGRRLGRRLRSP